MPGISPRCRQTVLVEVSYIAIICELFVQDCLIIICNIRAGGLGGFNYPNIEYLFLTQYIKH